MADLFGIPKRGKRESRIGLDRVRASVARIEKRIEAGAASISEMERISSLRRRLIHGERKAREAWQKAFEK